MFIIPLSSYYESETYFFHSKTGLVKRPVSTRSDDVYATCAYEKSVSRVVREYSSVTSMMHAHLVLRATADFLSLLYSRVEHDGLHLAEYTHRHAGNLTRTLS